jgi:hypothetical protein
VAFSSSLTTGTHGDIPIPAYFPPLRSLNYLFHCPSPKCGIFVDKIRDRLSSTLPVLSIHSLTFEPPQGQNLEANSLTIAKGSKPPGFPRDAVDNPRNRLWFRFALLTQPNAGKRLEKNTDGYLEGNQTMSGVRCPNRDEIQGAWRIWGPECGGPPLTLFGCKCFTFQWRRNTFHPF